MKIPSEESWRTSNTGYAEVLSLLAAIWSDDPTVTTVALVFALVFGLMNRYLQRDHCVSDAKAGAE